MVTGYICIPFKEGSGGFHVQIRIEMSCASEYLSNMWSSYLRYSLAPLLRGPRPLYASARDPKLAHSSSAQSQ